MAHKLGLSLEDYKRIENDCPLNMNYLIKLSQSVGKSIDELLNMKKEGEKLIKKRLFLRLVMHGNQLMNLILKLKIS